MKRTLIALINLVLPFIFTAQVIIKKPEINESQFKRELSFFGGPAYSDINNSNIKGDPYANAHGHLALNAGVNYYLPLTKNFGYSFGLEYNSFKKTTEYKGYFQANQTKTNNGGIYYPLVEANYSQVLSIQALDLPMCLRLQGEVMKNIVLFFDGGVKLNAILSYKSTLNGDYNKKGLYLTTASNQFYLVENYPSLGFTNTRYNNISEKVESTKVGLSYLLSCGVKAKTSERTFISVTCNYMVGINDLNSKTDEKYINVFDERRDHTKYTLFQTAIRVGFGIKLD